MTTDNTEFLKKTNSKIKNVVLLDSAHICKRQTYVKTTVQYG